MPHAGPAVVLAAGHDELAVAADGAGSAAEAYVVAAQGGL